MKATQIYSLNPGTVALLYCEGDRVEEAVQGIRSAVPPAFKQRTALNSCETVSMEICGEEAPNSFRDLAALCSRLVVSAGRRSHFEGLLLLNIAGLARRPEDADRLRALGEVLAMRPGLASRCVSVLYGVTREPELLDAANCLDFDGRLRVERFEFPEHAESLQALLKRARLDCDSTRAAGLLQDTLDEMRQDRRFDPVHFFQSCSGREGTITEASVRVALDDPFSYVNRLKKTRPTAQSGERPTDRRIGFQSHR